MSLTANEAIDRAYLRGDLEDNEAEAICDELNARAGKLADAERERDRTRAAVRAFIDRAWFRGHGPCPGCGFGRKLDGSTFHGSDCKLAALAAQVGISADPPVDPYAEV